MSKGQLSTARRLSQTSELGQVLVSLNYVLDASSPCVKKFLESSIKREIPSFAKTLQGRKSRPVTMLQAHPHAIHFQTHSGFWRRTRFRNPREEAVSRVGFRVYQALLKNTLQGSSGL